jgi:hypothetical protein
LHLAEVVLARQSGQVPEKNQESVILEMIFYGNRATAQVVQMQFINADIFHLQQARAPCEPTWTGTTRRTRQLQQSSSKA